MGISEYEDWRDEQRRRVYLDGGEIVVDFGVEFRAPLADFKYIEKAIHHAEMLSLFLIEQRKSFDHADLTLEMLRLASRSVPALKDAEQVFRGHELVILDQILLGDQDREADSTRGISFDSRGALALHLWREFGDGSLRGPLHVKREKIGSRGNFCIASCTAVKLYVTKTHLVLAMPAKTEWEYTHTERNDDRSYWNRATRIALRHEFDTDTRDAVIGRIAALCEGLEFETENRAGNA